MGGTNSFMSSRLGSHHCHLCLQPQHVHSQCPGFYSPTYTRELPKRRVPKQESAVFWEEASEGRWGPVSKQKRQLLVDCLTTIIRCHIPSLYQSILLMVVLGWKLGAGQHRSI